MLKKRIVVLVMVLTLFTLSGCALNLTGKGPLVLVDDFDREVTLEKPAEKIISLVPSVTEVLFALEVGERIVGVSEFCNYPEEAQEITQVGGFDGPNIELIVSLEPDLVFATSLHKEAVETLEGLNITVLALDPQDIAGISANIELMAKAVGKEQIGIELIEGMQKPLAEIAEKVDALAEGERPLVFFEGWYPGISTAGEGTFIDEVITLAGGKNLAWGISRWDNIQEEEVLARNPAFIVHGYTGAILGGDEHGYFSRRAGWDATTAVAEENIVFIDPDIINRTSHRIVLAIEQLARSLHPDLFGQ